MKSRERITVLLALMVFGTGSAWAGNENQNGGDGCASRFAGIARKVGNKISMICTSAPEAPQCGYLSAYLRSLANTTVYSADHVYGKDGKERDATNNGKDQITVNRARWNEAVTRAEAAEQWIRVAVHEYLGTGGVEESDTYSISDQFVTLLKDQDFDLNRIANIGIALPKRSAAGFTFGESFFNGDGSVTFVEPRFQYQNKELYVQSQETGDRSKDVGRFYCKSFGLGEPGLMEVRDAPRRSYAAGGFDLQGKLMWIWHTNWRGHARADDGYTTDSPVNVFKSITCFR